MSVTRQEKTVTVEKRSDLSETNATVTENGKSGSAKGATAGEALNPRQGEGEGGIAVPPLPLHLAPLLRGEVGEAYSVTAFSEICQSLPSKAEIWSVFIGE